jgi:alpha-L-fucosidase
MKTVNFKIKTKMKQLVLIICTFVCFHSIQAQSKYVPSKENLETRESFQNDKFGMFIHWGVYSILGDAEWVMHNQNIPVDSYKLLPTFFNPIDFNAKEVVQLAKDAGMKYITITTKHHDGFAMYDSKVSDYNIVKATPYGKDIFRALAQECKKQGIKLFAYYSQLDWQHPDYFPRGRTGNNVGREEVGNWNDYLIYQDEQIKELAENYDIAGFWFDGFWDILKEKGSTLETRQAAEVRWDIERTYNTIHSINPKLLIGNNHHLVPFEGEDFQMFEKDLPGKNTTGFGGLSIGDLPLETCETINHSWGFNLQDDKHKSVKELIQYLVKAAGNNANFLLNVGPMPNGKIQEEHIKRLKSVGDWLKNNGETIYGTRAGMIHINENIVSTQKGKKIYLHILKMNESNLTIPDFNERIKSVKLFNSKEKLKYKLKSGELQIELPIEAQNKIDTIVEILLK